MLDSFRNGCIKVEIRKLRGVFEVLLVLCGHEDTPEVHRILGLLEQVMVLYPSHKFDKLECHCIISEKYGFRSDIFAEPYLRLLLAQKNKMDKNRAIIHKLHLFLREIELAGKFLNYLAVARNPPREQAELAARMASELFASNIRSCFPETENNVNTFLGNPSFGHHIYLKRVATDYINYEFRKRERTRIEKIAGRLQIKNCSKSYFRLLQESSAQGGFRGNLRLDHSTLWR
jgi:hypothetical protein